MAAASEPSNEAFQAMADKALDFINSGVSPYHAVAKAKEMLTGAGFVELDESEQWAGLEAGTNAFIVRNQSAVIAFSVGGAYKSYEGGLSMIGAHTDSPCLKLRPESHVTKSGFMGVSVEVYGGPILHTWFDRDLGIAGRVVHRTESGVQSTLVHIDRPLVVLPTLAIHLERTVNSSGFKFNPETEMVPIIASAAKAALEAECETMSGNATVLMRLLAEEAGCEADAIVDFDLVLCDTQAGAFGGITGEFINASRLDNLMMSFCALEALTSEASLAGQATDTNIRVVALFDKEEVGSQAEHGANSNLLERVVKRVLLHAQDTPTPAPELFDCAMRKSLFVSADMAHAVHPNYAGKHSATCRPSMNAGPVIKFNEKERYATNGVSSAVLAVLAANHGIPLQRFSCRNDMPCGSTIGPMTAAHLGVRCVDMGNPQLSMHSIRETCGRDDVLHSVRLFEAFFSEFGAMNIED